MQAYLELLEIPQTSCTKQPYLQQRDSIRIKTIRHKSCSYYLNKGDKIYTDEIVKK
jgi:D-alanine-D-alanine ligase